MNKRLTDDPRNLARECESWDWARTAGVTDKELRDSLAAGPKDAPRRRSGERPAVRTLERFHRK
jgi:hypothetical protein